MNDFSRRGMEERHPGGTVEGIFESLLASKLRSEIRGEPEDIIYATDKEHEMLTGLPIKAFGDVFHVGDGLTAVVGDVEVPKGSIVDTSLVVKGNVKVDANCRILKNLKALGGISIAEGCVVRANVVSGDTVELGENTIVEGEVRAEVIRLSEGAGIHGRVYAGKVQSVHQSIERSPRETLDTLLGKAAELLGENNG